MPERTEEDVLSGVLLVALGTTERALPIRSIGSAREWKRELTKAMAGGIGTMNLESMADGGDVAAAFGDRILDLVVSYDETSALGGREFLERTATDPQIYRVFRRLLDVSFPFVRDLRTAIVELRAMGLADLLAAAAPSGGSLPARSTSDSSPSSESDRLVASTPS